MARLVGINHVAVQVGDIDEMLAFLEKLVDRLDMRGRGGRMAFVDLGDQFIALEQASEPVTAGHYGLVVDDQDEVVRRARDAGARMVGGHDFLDPWGNHWQVVDYRDVQFTKDAARAPGHGARGSREVRAGGPGAPRQGAGRLSVGRAVVVTGASSGIGLASALRLARSGWRVLGGVRTEEAAAELREGGVEPLQLDVTDTEQIAAAVDAAGSELQGLVDNAGIAVAAPLELVPLDELRRQLEVNVVGQVAVLQAFLPALRRGRGRVVLMGSVGGRSALPFLGPYAASKHALEAFADVLRVELEPWGMSVSIVEPASVRTAIWTKGAEHAEAMRQRPHRRRGRALRGADREVPRGRAEAWAGNRPRRRREGGRACAHGLAPEGPLPRRA